MPVRAHVQSIDALKDFRTRLCIFRERAKQAVDEAMQQVHGTRTWLQHERLVACRREIDRRTQRLADARADLNRARMSDLQHSGETEARAVALATRALREAEEKLRVVRHWVQGFESTAQPCVLPLRRLTDFLDQDAPQAIALLDRFIETLSEYARMAGAVPAESGAIRNDTEEERDRASPV